jgi:dienelactone hydrolase
MQTYHHLGVYSDLVDEANRHVPLYPLAKPGRSTQQKVREVLGWCDRPETPIDVQIEGEWEKDGLCGQAISWSVGYGPRTQAWLFKPAGVDHPLPGVLALHDHGGFKFCGKEKIAEGPEASPPYLVRWRENAYGGRAWVNALAREGFAVLVHDTFLWSSRRFPTETIQAALQMPVPADVLERELRENLVPAEVAAYNYLTQHHEHLVEKYLNLVGTGLPGTVCHEDRIALAYLQSRPDVKKQKIACMGLSGGGNRAALLRATAKGLKAAAIIGLMSTYAGLLDHNVVTHTWMFYPSGWARYGDWPDLAACQAPAPLLVQYDLEDDLFTEQGMRDAHERIAQHYRAAGRPDAYTGQFYPGPHKFDVEMQCAAFNWLKQVLR